MKITAIKQQVRRKDRYSIYIDGKYVCAFSEGELLRLQLRIGQGVSPEQLEDMKDDSVLDKARYQAYDLVARRPRSEWEMYQFLKRKDYTDEIIAGVVGQLKEQGYLDDYRFATSWVASRRLLKATNQRRLRLELRQKHVDDNVIQKVLEEDETDDRDALRRLVEQKRRQTRYQDPVKLMQYLARQGFAYDDIKQVIGEQQD